MSRGGRPKAQQDRAALATAALDAVKAVGAATQAYGVACHSDASPIEVEQKFEAAAAAIRVWEKVDARYKAARRLAGPAHDDYIAANDSTSVDIEIARRERRLWNTRRGITGG